MIIDNMSKDLRITTYNIKRVINNSNAYRKYTIKKRNGGIRNILHPSKDIKLLQRWIVENVFLELPISKYATAYEKGCSTTDNARKHCYNGFLLHLDLENFFESITQEHVEKLLKPTGKYSDEDIDIICKLTMYRGRLTIGAVSSPCIANRVMREFDEQIAAKLESLGEYIYTRYADDIVLSSKSYIPENIIKVVEEELAKEHLRLNIKKTYFSTRKNKRQVSGIILDNNRPNLSYGSKNIMLLKKEIYSFVTSDILSKDADLKAHIIGLLSYLKGINEDQYISLINKYKKYKYADSLFGDKKHFNRMQ